MAGRLLVALFLSACLLSSSLAEDEKPMISKEDNVEPKDDLETAETADIYYAFKNKLESLFNPLKGFKRGAQPSYRQYYGAPTPTYGVSTYQYKQAPSFKQQIWDCFHSGGNYGSGQYSGSGSSYYPGGSVSYYPGGSGGSGYYSGGSSAYYPGSDNGYAGISYGTPSKSYFLGGKPAFSSKGNLGGSSGLQGTFGASVSASIGGNGDAGYSSSFNSPGYTGFKPSKSYSYTYETPSINSYYPRYNEPKSASPTYSYYYSNTAPQLSVPQYVQNTQPLQGPSTALASQGVFLSSTPKAEIDASTQAPPAIAVSVYVPESSHSPEIFPGGVPVNPPTSVVPIPSTTESPSIPITQRPQYNIQNSPTTPAPGSVYSIYASDTYVSQPVYSPAFPHGHEGFIGGTPVNSPPGKNNPPATGFFYYVPVYYNLANNPPPSSEYQLGSGAAESGSQGAGIAFPTSTQASPQVNCH